MADSSDDQDYFGGLAQDLLGKSGVTPYQNAGLGSGLAQGSQPAPAPQVPAIPPSTTIANPAAGNYAMVYYYTGEPDNPFGHIGISLNGGHTYGLDPIPGMEAQSVIRTVPGMVEPVDPNRKPVDQERIPVSAAQIGQLRQYLLNNAGHQSYSLTGPNCATYVESGLLSAGLKSPTLASALTPTGLMGALHQIYDAH